MRAEPETGKPLTRRLTLAGVTVLLTIVIAVFIMMVPMHPVAYVRVLDEAGVPVAGAVVFPEGLRTKPGPYVSGWYGWRTETNGGVPNSPVTTDEEGYARVPYPKYVFERIETGTLCLSVNHPDFVPDQPERIVATAPPAGAPWQIRANALLNQIRRKSLIARPDPIVLKKGAVLVVRVRNAAERGSRVFAQVSGVAAHITNFWIHAEPGVIVTRRLAAGPRTVRAVQVDSDGLAWFSDAESFTAVAGQTNEVPVDLKRGATVSGQLDSTVPRPVKNGRVVAHVWPQGCRPQDSPPQWHAWAALSEDGTFSIRGLPEGDLEIVALCEGFVSTNGPGQFQTRYPQKHLLGTNDLAITIGMEPTARLEVQVADDKGKPLKDVRVVTWPNVRYGEWSSVILMNDCYNSKDRLLSEPAVRSPWGAEVQDFQGMSDSSGLAVLRNIPATVNGLSVDHPRFSLPAVGTARDGKSRVTRFTLTPGQTNRLFIQLELTEQTPIAHY